MSHKWKYYYRLTFIRSDTNIISPSVNDIADEIIKSGDSDLMKLLPQNVRNKYANKILNDAMK